MGIPLMELFRNKGEIQTYNPSIEEETFLTQRNWVRVGQDLWRNVDTTEELDTKDALNLEEQLDKFVEENRGVLQANTMIIGDSILGGESPGIQLAEVVEFDSIIEEPKAKPRFPDEIRQQLKQQFCVITGKAGSGKTTLLTLEDEEDISYIEKGSTTGIAAINCGGRTVNSLLKYFNTPSLQKAFDFGKLHNRLRMIRGRKRVLGIDEMSMLSAEQLDIIVNAIFDINEDEDKPRDLGLHLIGDFLQLPPIKAEFCFKAACWKELFEPNIVKLEKIWRQGDQTFVDAINAIRAGKGKSATELLKKAGVKFERNLIPKFEGTTLIPNNKDVDAFNNKRLGEIDSPIIRYAPVRRGMQAKEWDKTVKRDGSVEWGIPFEQRFKVDAYVMLLRNDSQEWKYVNGDCGIIKSYDKATNTFKIEVKRTNEIVDIRTVKQYNYQDEQPDEKMFNSMFYPYEDSVTGMWIIGSIEYLPLRLAYASTLHKSQGLSLDLVQVDTRPDFFGYPAMCYVGISRAKTPEGLIIIGNESEFASKVNTNPEVLRYI